MRSDEYLVEGVAALDFGGCLANFLNSRQQQTNQDGNDREDDKQLDEREGRASARVWAREHVGNSKAGNSWNATG